MATEIPRGSQAEGFTGHRSFFTLAESTYMVTSRAQTSLMSTMSLERRPPPLKSCQAVYPFLWSPVTETGKKVCSLEIMLEANTRTCGQAQSQRPLDGLDMSHPSPCHLVPSGSAPSLTQPIEPQSPESSGTSSSVLQRGIIPRPSRQASPFRGNKINQFNDTVLIKQ